MPPDVPKNQHTPKVEVGGLGNEAARDLSSRPETLSADQAKQILGNQEASATDKLKAAEALFKSGIKQIQISDHDGKNRTYTIERIRLAGKQNMVHIFGQDDQGVRRVVLRGVSNDAGAFSKERGADGKFVDFEGSWWSKAMAKRSPMLGRPASPNGESEKITAQATPKDLTWHDTPAGFTEVKAGQRYIAAPRTTVQVDAGGEAIINSGAIAAVAPGGKIAAALPGAFINTFGQGIEIHNYGARIFYKGKVDITDLPDDQHPGIKIVNEDIALLDRNIGRKPKGLEQPTVVVAQRTEPDKHKGTLLAMNELPAVELTGEF